MADQVDPNALAAPASGFGQTVSFAFNPQGEPPQVRPITSSGPRVGSNGVSQGRKSDTRFTPVVETDPTAALLMKVGGEILGKRVDEARTEEYVAGMQRAMSGEALDEVKQSVPWYAKIFGDTPTIEGARAYTAQDIVNKTLTEQTAKMTELAKMPPEVASKHFASVLKGAVTGDGTTDAIIMKQMVEQMPTLMKVQAKAHVEYGQKRAMNSLNQSIVSGAAGVQELGEAYAGGKISDKDMKTRMDAFVLSVIPPDGINEENYQKTLTSSIVGMAQQGQFHAIEALKSRGVTNALTAEQANRIEAAITSNANKARDNYAFKFSKELAEIKSDAAHPPEGMKPSDLSKRIDASNDAFKKLTGSPVGLFTSDQKADMLAGTFNAFKAEETRAQRAAAVLADKTATATAKAAAAAETDATVSELVAKGQITLAKKLPGVSNDDVDLKVYKLAKQDPDGAKQFLRNAWAQGEVSTLIANEIQTPMAMLAGDYAKTPSMGAPNAFFESVNAYRAMSQQGGPAFAAAYFGEHAKSLAFASYMLKDNVLANPAADSIFQRAMTLKDVRTEKLDAKEQAEVTKKVVSEGRTYLPTWAGGTALREDTVRMLSEDVQDGTAQWMAAGFGKQEATAMALNDALGPNRKGGGARGEIVGGYYIRDTENSSQTRLSALMEGGNGAPYTAVPEALKGEIFEKFLADKVRIPGNAATVKIHRVGDLGGVPQFNVFAVDKDGMPYPGKFSAAELQSFAADRTKWARTPNRIGTRATTPEEDAAWNAEEKRRRETPVDMTWTSPNLSFGPENVMRPAEGTPSIYASAEERARMQAEQRRKASTK